MPERTVRHRTRQERADLGRVARRIAPRSGQAVFEATESRPDPIELLERQAESRVPELVPIRYGRMLVSPFAFFRGAALIMASDLATTARSGLTVQLCGDAHLCNFGAFGSPERELVFDVNDFDETLPGPWEWDVKRLAASVVVAARDRGFSPKKARKAARRVAKVYRHEMRRLAGLGNLDVWYSSTDVQRLLADLQAQAERTGSKRDRALASRATTAAAKAQTRDSHQALEKLTVVRDGQRRILSQPPLIVPLAELLPDRDQRRDLHHELHQLLRRYRASLQPDRRHLLEQFEMVDLAHKVVGVGSVGTRAWIILLLGVDGDDPLFLQAKEAGPSVLEEFVGRSVWHNHGQRVVAGQHLMQAASDIFLGWERVEGLDGVTRDFYIRQLRDWKGSLDPATMVPAGLIRYAALCAQTLARAHARSGDRVAIAAYLGSSKEFDHAIAAFAETYADQNQRDYDALGRAVDDGRIHAETGL